MNNQLFEQHIVHRVAFPSVILGQIVRSYICPVEDLFGQIAKVYIRRGASLVVPAVTGGEDDIARD
jgi:hypothetical protein